MFEVQLNISDAQLRKLHNGHNVQLSSDDLGHGTSFNVSKKFNTKVNRAMKNNSGLRINLQDLNLNLEGGDLLKKIGIKKAVIKYGNKYGLPIAKTVATAVLPAASKAVGDAVAGYTGSPLLGEVAKSMTKELGKKGIEEIPNGGAVSMRMMRGSPEAKSYMANLRASKKGGSFRPNGGSFRPNGGAIMNGLVDGHYAVLPNSNMFNGMHAHNGNPILSKMKSTQSLYNDAPRLIPKHGRGLRDTTIF